MDNPIIQKHYELLRKINDESLINHIPVIIEYVSFLQKHPFPQFMNAFLPTMGRRFIFLINFDIIGNYMIDNIQNTQSRIPEVDYILRLLPNIVNEHMDVNNFNPIMSFDGVFEMEGQANFHTPINRNKQVNLQAQQFQLNFDYKQRSDPFEFQSNDSSFSPSRLKKPPVVYDYYSYYPVYVRCFEYYIQYGLEMHYLVLIKGNPNKETMQRTVDSFMKFKVGISKMMTSGRYNISKREISEQRLRLNSLLDILNPRCIGFGIPAISRM